VSIHAPLVATTQSIGFLPRSRNPGFLPLPCRSLEDLIIEFVFVPHLILRISSSRTPLQHGTSVSHDPSRCCPRAVSTCSRLLGANYASHLRVACARQTFMPSSQLFFDAYANTALPIDSLRPLSNQTSCKSVRTKITLPRPLHVPRSAGWRISAQLANAPRRIDAHELTSIMDYDARNSGPDPEPTRQGPVHQRNNESSRGISMQGSNPP
jgi:hypothetical protein